MEISTYTPSWILGTLLLSLVGSGVWLAFSLWLKKKDLTPLYLFFSMAFATSNYFLWVHAHQLYTYDILWESYSLQLLSCALGATLITGAFQLEKQRFGLALFVLFLALGFFLFRPLPPLPESWQESSDLWATSEDLTFYSQRPSPVERSLINSQVHALGAFFLIASLFALFYKRKREHKTTLFQLLFFLFGTGLLLFADVNSWPWVEQGLVFGFPLFFHVLFATLILASLLQTDPQKRPELLVPMTPIIASFLIAYPHGSFFFAPETLALQYHLLLVGHLLFLGLLLRSLWSYSLIVSWALASFFLFSYQPLWTEFHLIP